MAHYSWHNDQLTLHILLQPNASTDEIIGVQDRELKIRIAAAPIEGKANTQLIKFLSKQFGVRKQDINLVRGETSRHKKVSITAPTKLPLPAQITTNR